MKFWNVLKKIIQIVIAAFPKKSARVIEKVEDVMDKIPTPIIEPVEIPLPTPSNPVTQVNNSNLVETTPTSSNCYLIDNGHGADDPINQSPVLPDGRIFYEWKFNRIIAREVVRQLKEKRIECLLVVPEDNVDNFLKGRVDRANEYQTHRPKIFISIHANAMPAKFGQWADTASGIETWYLHKNTESRSLAEIFQRHLVAATGWKNRWVKSRPNRQFYVLRKTTMPAIVTENGFFNHQKQCLELMKPEVQQAIADAHVAAIEEIEKNQRVPSLLG